MVNRIYIDVLEGWGEREVNKVERTMTASDMIVYLNQFHKDTPVYLRVPSDGWLDEGCYIGIERSTFIEDDTE